MMSTAVGATLEVLTAQTESNDRNLVVRVCKLAVHVILTQKKALQSVAWLKSEVNALQSAQNWRSVLMGVVVVSLVGVLWSLAY